MQPAVASHRGFRRRSYPQLLGAHAPACLCTRLFTSSPCGAAACYPSARLEALRIRVEVHHLSLPSPSDQFALWAVAGSFRKQTS